MTGPRFLYLSGGVGGARLAHGLADLLPADRLTLVVNTGDDFVHWGLNISPDLDTCMYTLAQLAHPERVRALEQRRAALDKVADFLRQIPDGEAEKILLLFAT